MLRNLGAEEAESILAERDDIEVGCEFAASSTALMRWMRRRFLSPQALRSPGADRHPVTFQPLLACGRGGWLTI